MIKALVFWLGLVFCLPLCSLAQRSYLRFSCLIVDDLPPLQAITQQLRQAGINTFLVYEPTRSSAQRSGASATYLLWTDGRTTWGQLILPTAIYQPVRLPATRLFTYPKLWVCGAVQAEDNLDFAPPVIGSENDFVAYTSPKATFYFEHGHKPLGYSPAPERQVARRQFVAQLTKELAAINLMQQLAQPYQRKPVAPAQQCTYRIFGN